MTNILTIQVPSDFVLPNDIQPMTTPTKLQNNEDDEVVIVNLPPDLVSASSCSSDAVDDIISDLSLDARELNDQEDTSVEDGRPRSIFGGYWKNHEPIALQHKNHPTSRSLPADWKLQQEEESDQDTVEMYERTLKQKEGVTPKRQLFPNRSTPSLRKSYGEAYLRMANSSSQLNPRIKTKSCLRQKGKGSSGQHVSFATKVKVMEYKIPKENRVAQEGWSKYFH